MQHIMIVTASTGGGHNSAAHYLKQSFEERGIFALTIDMFKATSKASNYVMQEGYNTLAEKAPKLYGTLYRWTNQKQLSDAVFSTLFTGTVFRLSYLLDKIEPKLLIATHPFAGKLIGHLKHKGRTNVPLMQIVTDFIPHNSYFHKNIDVYVVASEYSQNALIEMGVNKERIYTYGIPVKKSFYNRKERAFNEDKPLQLLIMGGSMGLSAIASVIRELISGKNRQHLTLTVVCGRNKELYDNLAKEYQEDIREGKIILHGFVDNVDELMESCDLIVSKPGGLTASEAILKSIPMIIPFYIPGQEHGNVEFLVEHNMAIEARDIEQLNSHLEQFIEHPELYRKMSKNMQQLNKTYSIDKIVDLGVQMMKDRKTPDA